MILKILTEHHLEFLSLRGGCRGSFESTLVKMSNCSKSHAAAHFIHRYIIIKHRSSLITDKINQLLSELWPLISV